MLRKSGVPFLNKMAMIWMLAYFFLFLKITLMLEDIAIIITTTTPTTLEHRRLLSTMHVGFGLSGNGTGFLSEFEVALKSVLLHAPLERDMHVHIIADQDAYQSLGEIFNRNGLSTWVTRNLIKIHAYDITSVLPQ